MKKMLCVMTAFLLLLTAYGALAESSADSSYRFFEKPEDAILYFVERVAAADFEGALHATAAESMAAGYDLPYIIERMGSYVPNMTMRWPSAVYPEYASINRIAQEASTTNQLYGLVSSLLVDPELYGATPYKLSEDNIQISEDDAISLEALVAAFDPARLSDLSVKAVYRVDSELYLSERMQETIAKQGATYGYTDAKELFVLYQFEGSNYAHAYTVVKFPGGWQISSLSAAFIGTGAYGTVVPVPHTNIEDFGLDELNLIPVYEAG